ncbi:MAG: hypothetical protein KDE59_16855 [Anaerolineales bacterium]|nr:hypothetical protein [Anaerolineales bacterium]MCB0031311.1 hypothetical protein [Anaerolineales bacterium]
MDYGKMFSRAANLVWENKFLIFLGVLASLASSGSSSGSGGGGGGTGTGQPFPNGGQPPQIDAEVAGIAAGVIVALICVVLVVGLILWAVATIARGGLISGADTIESGGKSSFGQAWGAAWQKAGTLLGIGFLPAIPGLILLVLGVMALGAYGGLASLFGESFALPAGLTTGVVLVACIMLPIALVLSILRTFAERAALLENLGVMDSYRRGTEVLRANLGEAILLFLLQIALAVGLGIILFVPSIFMAFCCFLWPVLLLIQGAITAFVSTLWTLAWRQWTGKAAPAKVVPAV